MPEMSESIMAPRASEKLMPFYLKYEKPKDKAKKNKTGFREMILRKLKGRYHESRNNKR